MGIDRETCICVGEEPNRVFIPVGETPSVSREQIRMKTSIKVGGNAECVERYKGGMFDIDAQQILDIAHYIRAGWVSFARGLNDTPKIAGLLVVLHALDIEYSLTAIRIAIAAGGLISARKVGETVSHKITPMNHGQGFTANLITGLLVATASIHGMPVSTTHVSVGSIFAIATVSGEANGRVIVQILSSWLLTLPTAFVFSAVTYWLLSTVIPA
jgi:PiT family inorganic phosphate transporter